MKRLAIIATNESEHLGGSEDLWIRSAACLKAAGVEVHANLSGRSRHSPSLRRLEASVTTHAFRELPAALPAHRRLLNRFRPDPLSAWLRRTRPELVLISQGANLDGGDQAAACREAALPYVLLSQAAGEWHGPYFKDYLGAREAHRHALLSCFVSDANRRLTELQLALTIPRARVVRNPFNVPYHDPPAWPPPGDAFRCAVVGRLDIFCKGHDLLFAALAHPRWKSRPARFSLFGSGPHSRTLHALKAKWGLDQVEFRGHVADIRAIWEEHHLLVLPSRQEGLPLALVEAMLCRRPALVTAVAGNTEILEAGRHGFVAAAAHPGCVADSLEQAWEHRDEWQAMGEEAGRHVRSLVPADPAADFAALLLAQAGPPLRP